MKGLLSRRDFLRIVGLGAAATLAAACTPPAPTAAPTTAPKVEKGTTPAAVAKKLQGAVLYWAPWQEQGELMAKMFSDAQPDIKVTWELGEYDTNQKLFAVLAAGNPPDVAYLGRWQHPDLAVRNAIFNLDDRVASAKNFKWTDLWDRLQSDSLVWGKKWCVPFTTDTRAFFYNKKLMADAGLDPEKPPTTFDELQAQAVKATKKDSGGRIDVIGFTPTFGNPPVHLWFYTMMWCQNYSIMNAEKTKCQAATPQGEMAMKIIKDIMDAQGGYENAVAFTKALTPGEGLDAFSANKVVFAMNGQWVFANLDKYAPKLEYGMIPGPIIPEFKINANYDGGGGFYLFKQGRSKNPDASWEFVDWWMNPEPYYTWCQKYNSMPARKDVTERWAKGDARRTIFASTAGTCRWIDLYVGRVEESQAVADMFNNILISNKPIKDELAILQGKVQALLDRHSTYPVPS